MEPTPVTLGPLAPGSQVGPYEVIGHLATGGMGEVYLGRKRSIGGFERTVVLKVMLSHLTRDKRFAQMFIDEARIASSLSHPNIVQVYDLDRSEIGALYLAMEHLQGQSVVACLKKSAQAQSMLPVAVVARIVCDAATGLGYAHSAMDRQGEPLELVHRDISPENLFVTYAGPTKVLDFGVAKVRDRLAKTQQGEFKGKVGYMAPEIIRAEHVDHRSDLFSLGVVLFELLTCRRLFHASNPATALHRVLTAKVPPVSSVRPQVDPVLSKICMGMLERDPRFRIKSADEVADRLERWLAGQEGTSKHVGAWLREVFHDAHEMSAQIAQAVEHTGRVDPKVLERARALGGEELEDTLIRGLSVEETAPSQPASTRAFNEPAQTFTGGEGLGDAIDTGWIVRARAARWLLGLLLIAVLGGGFALGGSKVKERLLKGPAIGPYRMVTQLEQTPLGTLQEVTKDEKQALLLFASSSDLRQEELYGWVQVAATHVDSLDDPQIGTMVKVGKHEGGVYTAFEWSEGRSLAEVLERELIPRAKGRKLVLDLLAAFVKASEHGLVHGRLEPNLVWMRRDGEPRILGFQMGYLAPGQADSSKYLAPEAKIGERQSAAGDQYALGVLINEVLRAADQEAAIRVAPMIAKATAVNPLARYRTMAEFRQDVARGLKGK